jgi:DNA helicase II / ATP-dependent DNA helicase PcrA
MTDADALLEDLNDAQREAVLASSGPVVILAGAGTGKTRVISRRAAYAIATGVVPASDVLVVTFTDKAAGEMASRLANLGQPGVTARTFHAHALSQLGYFWPAGHDGAPMPEILSSKIPIVGRLARALPGGYRFTAAKDLADEIEWAKSRRITPATYAASLDSAGVRTPPIPVELFARLYADYERAKERAGRIDFDDMLIGTVELLETDDAARAVVQARKRWISVDEYQDTNPLQERLLELWLGERTDLCVVGDPDQTIYTFTGATSDFLTGFAGRHPGTTVVALTENYRSTPQVLDLANRAIGRAGGSTALRATRDGGPPPTIRYHRDGHMEATALAAEAKRLIGSGVAPVEIAVLTRINAQLATIEAAFTTAGVPYQVRGQRFFERREVRDAIALIRRAAPAEQGAALVDAVRALWAAELGYGDEALLEGAEGRERAAALDTLLEIARDLRETSPDLDAAGLLDDLAARAAAERTGAVAGVNLLTYHRAKGLEWDAVFLPMLEEGSLPISHALNDPVALEEERRLLYVGITRARVHLALSWAETRANPNGSVGRKKPSRFLDALEPKGVARPRPVPGRVTVIPDTFAPPLTPAGEGILAALKAWRTARARHDAVPAYVIAHDATLEAIADARPMTIPALRRVKGMGPGRLEKYGEEILAITGRAAD